MRASVTPTGHRARAHHSCCNAARTGRFTMCAATIRRFRGCWLQTGEGIIRLKVPPTSSCEVVKLGTVASAALPPPSIAHAGLGQHHRGS